MKSINIILGMIIFFVCNKLVFADDILIDKKDISIKSPPYVMPLSAQEIKHMEREKECLAKNIYFEAAYEPEEGMLAVAQVTKNRVLHPLYPKTYCDVVWQINTDKRTGKRVAQFSWTLDGKPDTPHNKDIYNFALKIAEEVLQNKRDSDIIGTDVYHYHAVYVRPRWAKRMNQIAKIGNHLFYSN